MKLFFAVFLCFCIWSNDTAALYEHNISALYSFGDSIVDTGNNNHLSTLTKSNFPPYGRDFYRRIPTGRFCNGRIITDFIAEGLKIKSFVPAYLQRNLESNESITGVSFASAGSGLDPATSSWQQVISMVDQVNMFRQYIESLNELVGEERASSIISNALILVSTGNNDIGITFTIGLKFVLGYEVYSTQLVNLFSSFLRELYDLGARRFAILSTIPVASIPAARTVGGILVNLNSLVDEATRSFNAKLETEVNNLSRTLPGSKVVFVDVHDMILYLIQNPASHGFTNVENGCCGTGTVEFGLLCNEFHPFTCRDASKYVFWDAVHPSESTARLLASQILRIYGSRF